MSGHLDFHAQQRRTESLALRIAVERKQTASDKRAMQDEVERVQVGQLKPLDFAAADAGEVLLDAFRCDLAYKKRIVLGLESDQADVGDVAFIAGAGVSDLAQLDFSHVYL